MGSQDSLPRKAESIPFFRRNNMRKSIKTMKLLWSRPDIEDIATDISDDLERDLKDWVEEKGYSVVEVSEEGTSEVEAKYITVDGQEFKLGGGGGGQTGFTVHFSYLPSGYLGYGPQDKSDLFLDGTKRFTPAWWLDYYTHYNNRFQIFFDNITTVQAPWDYSSGYCSGRYKMGESDSWHTYRGELLTLTDNLWLEIDIASCLLKGTLITMADGTQKPIELIHIGEDVKSYNGIETVISCDSTNIKLNDWYDEWTFEDGTVIKTTHQHRFYNTSTHSFAYLKKYAGEYDQGDEWKIGDYALNEHGEKVKLVKHRHVKKQCQHYTLFTSGSGNYYANGLLSGNRNSKLGD